METVQTEKKMGKKRHRRKLCAIVCAVIFFAWQQQQINRQRHCRLFEDAQCKYLHSASLNAVEKLKSIQFNEMHCIRFKVETNEAASSTF